MTLQGLESQLDREKTYVIEAIEDGLFAMAHTYVTKCEQLQRNIDEQYATTAYLKNLMESTVNECDE